MNVSRKIRVLVVDDSALSRRLLTSYIDAAPDMEVVAAAPDALVARTLIDEIRPDVVTLDVEMPKMNGLEFLQRLMQVRPMPVLMISSLTERGSASALKALELGAVDVIGKPQPDKGRSMEDYAEEVRAKVRAAAQARVGVRVTPPARPTTTPLAAPPAGSWRANPLICIGASTGGTEALKALLMPLPANMPPILVVQHMPETFTRTFASRLDQLCALHVKEAEHDEPILAGTVYIAPGHSHLRVSSRGGRLYTKLSQDEPVNRHRPSVDVLFDSAVGLGSRALGIILTGMGKDGAQGMLRMREAGAYTFGQDQGSCVVYGMPREAAQVGAVREVQPLSALSGRLVDYLTRAR